MALHPGASGPIARLTRPGSGRGGPAVAVPIPDSSPVPVPEEPYADARQPARATRRLWAAGVLGVLLPALLFGTLVAWAALQSRRQHEQRAELLAQNLAGAIERAVSANIEKIDLALAAIVDNLEQQLVAGGLDPDAARRQILSQVAGRAELEGVRVTDAAGIGILGPGLENRPPVSFADREWFQIQRDRADAGFHMSRPLVSKLANVWIISFSRRLRGPDGRFAGAVSAAVPLSYLERELRTVDLGPHGAVAVRDATLGLIARHAPGAEPGSGAVGSRDVSAALQQATGAAASGVLRTGADARNANTATTAFRRSRAAPLLVVVDLAEQDTLAGWQAELQMLGALAGATLLLYGAGSVVLLRTLAQNRRARGRIELLAKVFEHGGEAVLVTDEQHRIVDANPALLRRTGYRFDEIVGHPVMELFSRRMPRAELVAMGKALKRDGRWRGEAWDQHKDGGDVPILLSIAAVHDAAGKVTHHICSSIDLSEVKQAEARMEHLAHHDTLTQLPNRVRLLQRLEQTLAQARSTQEQAAVLFIDMDRFKVINDTLGHQVGDGLLVEVGRRLRALVRDGDIVARLGGDEFVLVLPVAGQRGALAAQAVAHKVLEALGRPYSVRGHELHSTPSIGVALFPADGEDPDTLMKNADTAMYQAKATGRNNVQFFTSAMNQQRGERLVLEVGLRSAIERGQLSLHYQPQVDLASGRVIGLEALVRWQHPDLGWIPPLKFIPIAEDTGLIESIGAWVLEQALAEVRRWRDAGHAGLRVAVNLSAQQLRPEGFAAHVAAALQRHGLPGQALELEITESMAMADPGRTAELLGRLRALGVALAIDDFGTGYSSLAYLKQLPLSCLKLDRSFVRDIEHDPNDAAICTATIQMAHSLGLGVVAEGVETGEQLAFLRDLGCDTVQGYFISKPLPAADCGRFLQQQQQHQQQQPPPQGRQEAQGSGSAAATTATA